MKSTFKTCSFGRLQSLILCIALISRIDNAEADPNKTPVRTEWSDAAHPYVLHFDLIGYKWIESVDQHGAPYRAGFRPTQSLRLNRNKPPENSRDMKPAWRIDACHGWMDAPYALSKWKALWQTATLGEAYLVGCYPAALGIRVERVREKLSWGLQLGYREHFTHHYRVATLLDERHYSHLSVLALVEYSYLNGLRWSLGGQIGLGVGRHNTLIRAGPEAGNRMHRTLMSWQITPIILRINHRQLGGFAGMGYGSAGILQSGISYSIYPKRTFSP